MLYPIGACFSVTSIFVPLLTSIPSNSTLSLTFTSLLTSVVPSGLVTTMSYLAPGNTSSYLFTFFKSNEKFPTSSKFVNMSKYTSLSYATSLSLELYVLFFRSLFPHVASTFVTSTIAVLSFSLNVIFSVMSVLSIIFPLSSTSFMYR